MGTCPVYLSSLRQWGAGLCEHAGVVARCTLVCDHVCLQNRKERVKTMSSSSQECDWSWLWSRVRGPTALHACMRVCVCLQGLEEEGQGQAKEEGKDAGFGAKLMRKARRCSFLDATALQAVPGAEGEGGKEGGGGAGGGSVHGSVKSGTCEVAWSVRVFAAA